MNTKDQLKLDVLVKVVSGEMGRTTAQSILNISQRTLERYLSAYRAKGPLAVKHGNYQRSPHNKLSHGLKLRVQTLVKEKYFDFNMSHLLEKLVQNEEIILKRETLRKWCHEIKYVKRSKKRRAKARYARQRMQQRGLMLQMDGSPHRWFGNKPSCLIAAIDDADNDVPFAEFFPAEDTLSCLEVLKKIIEKNGLFQILYVDRAGIFSGPKRANFSQVKRALEELGIHIIFANSPEAKGRVERLFQTLQDRLIPEMRLRQITTYRTANSFLQEQFLPNEYSRKFKVIPANQISAYRPLPSGIHLREIFCLKEYRSVKRDHTLSWKNMRYSLVSPLKYSIYKQAIEIRTYLDLSWQAYYAGKPIELTPVVASRQLLPRLLKSAA